MSKKIRTEILEKADQGTLLHAIFHVYGKGRPNALDPTLVVLIELHNKGDIDLLRLISSEKLECYKGWVFSCGLHVYCTLLKHLNSSASDVVNTVDVLAQAQGGGIASPVNALEEWCALNPDKIAELFSLVEKNASLARNYLSIALKYGVHVDKKYYLDRAYDFLLHGTKEEVIGAINALGEIPLCELHNINRFIQSSETLLNSNPNDKIRGSLLSAVVKKLGKVQAEQQKKFIDVAITIAKRGGDHTLYSSARILAFNARQLPPEFVDGLFEVLNSVSSLNRDTVEMMDIAFGQLVEHGQASQASSFIAELLCRENAPIDLENYGAFCYYMFHSGEPILEDWVVSWLLNGDYALCRALDTAFGEQHAEHVFKIDFARFNLHPNDYPYLARKSIGAFFFRPKLMASFIVCLLRTAPTEHVDEILDLLLDPILINYSAVASEFLEPIAADEHDSVSVHIKHALTHRTKYLEGLSSIGDVPELHPSERERLMEWQRHSDSMAVVAQEARKRSIIGEIATVSTMLYGSRSVTWLDTQSSKTLQRMETPLASFSHSIEMPRVNIVAPLELQLILIQFRSEKRLK